MVRRVAGANVHLKGLVVKNRGWALEPLKEGGRFSYTSIPLSSHYLTHPIPSLEPS